MGAKKATVRQAGLPSRPLSPLGVLTRGGSLAYVVLVRPPRTGVHVHCACAQAAASTPRSMLSPCSAVAKIRKARSGEHKKTKKSLASSIENENATLALTLAATHWAYSASEKNEYARYSLSRPPWPFKCKVPETFVPDGLKIQF